MQSDQLGEVIDDARGGICPGLAQPLDQIWDFFVPRVATQSSRGDGCAPDGSDVPVKTERVQRLPGEPELCC